MNKVSDHKLLSAIKVTPVILIVIFVLIINSLIIYDNQKNTQVTVAALRDNIIERQRTFAQNQVEQLINQIELEQSLTINNLKENIKNRVNEAHAIASYIHKVNIDKPKKQITKLINDALRNIRFNDDRGYFFIYDIDGTNIMHPILTDIEGTSMWDFSDNQNKFVIRELSQIVQNQGEGFLTWQFVRNQNDYRLYDKIGFVKKFAPYNWFIGTGDYIDDTEKKLKASILSKISALRYGNNGFFIVLDKQGNVLYHPNDESMGKNYLKFKDSSGKLFVREFLEKSQSGGFVEYLAPESPYTPENNKKTSYVKRVANWDWIIITGWYSDELDKVIAKQQAIASDENDLERTKLMAISFTFTVFALYLSLRLSQTLTHRFKRFQNKVAHNFEELQHTKDKMQYMALHDDLTDLPNRVLLRKEINKGIALSKMQHSQLAVMFVDLDDFKKINDIHGHSMGDQLLVAISNKFKTLIGPDDIVARFGGDEFIFCFTHLKSENDARQRLEAIKQVFKNDFYLDGKTIHSSCSIGVTMYPQDATTPEDLISKADIVLYKSKEHQKGNILFYSDDINKLVQHDFLLEDQLRQAITKNELSIVYQPQICGNDETIFGVEALCRWHNDALGFVSPVEFIAAAEKTELIHDIGMFVINQACADFNKLQTSSHRDLYLSVNISPKQLIQPGFALRIKEAVQSHHVNIEQVTLEITENVLIYDIATITPILEELGNYGFDISLDDFGTGYSSLNYLSNLPIAEIKIDRSFIDKFLTSSESESLVKAIIAIGSSCSLRIVAEGVETEAQKARLQKYHCDVIQGYFFDKPLTIDALVEKYATQNQTKRRVI